MSRERKRGWRKQVLGGGALLAIGLALAGVGCSDSDATRQCTQYACGFAVSLPEHTVAVGEATQVDVHLCFEDDCKNGAIDLTRPDGSLPCTHWLGLSFVCLSPSAASGVYSVSATWGHQGADANGSTLPVPKKPADGSTYTLRLQDHATNAVLLDQTSQTSYIDGPNLDGCHPECWTAQISIGDAAGAGEGGAPPVANPNTPGG